MRYMGEEPAFEMKSDRICLYDFEDNYYEIDYDGNVIKDDTELYGIWEWFETGLYKICRLWKEHDYENDSWNRAIIFTGNGAIWFWFSM